MTPGVLPWSLWATAEPPSSQRTASAERREKQRVRLQRIVFSFAIWPPEGRFRKLLRDAYSGRLSRRGVDAGVDRRGQKAWTVPLRADWLSTGGPPSAHFFS